MQHTDSSTSSSKYPHLPESGEVREVLEHILASPYLQASKNRRAFLRYIVEETLAGHSGNLKGYTIAVTVFGRNESFDAQSDPVVRVEARRLRRDLDSYYMNSGNADSVRISIPKGAYVPYFKKINATESPGNFGADALKQTESVEKTGDTKVDSAKSTVRGVSLSRWAYLAAGLAVLAIATATWLLNDKSELSGLDTTVSEPSILVLPFESLGTSEITRYLAAGINQELVGNLMQFPGFRLFAMPNNLEMEPDTPTAVKNATYLINGNILTDNKEIHLVAQAVFAGTGEVVWSGTYDRPLNPESIIQLQSDLAATIATELGQPYGYFQADIQTRSTTASFSNMQSYVCVLRAYDYRRDFTREKFDPVMACLQAAVKNDPGYSDAWAMLGWLHLDAGRYDFDGSENLQDHYNKAFQAASHAVLLEPNNTLALKALSSINHYMGHFEEGERLARRAVALNPNDPDTLAQLGWRLAVRGNFDEGIPLLKQAIDRTVNPPGWYFQLIAIEHYRAGEYKQMLSVAQRAAADGSWFGLELVAIANGALKDREGARRSLAKMLEIEPLASDPGDYLRRHGATVEIVDMLVTGLSQAESLADGSSG